MLRAIVFDMDGVIVDSEPVYLQANHNVCAAYGTRLSNEENASFVGLPDRETWSCVKARHELSASVEELIAASRKEYRRLVFAKGIGPIDGIDALMRELHGHGLLLAVASSTSRAVVDEICAGLRLDRYLTAKAGGDEVPRGKPYPDVYVLAMQRLGVVPEHCVAIEDSRNGVRAAQAAGLKCVGFHNPSSGNQDLSETELRVAALHELSVEVLMSLC